MQETPGRCRARGRRCHLLHGVEPSFRSLRDFLNIFEYVQHHQCDLVCLKTVIDTTSPFSNLVVKILMVFAEFEREITAERTSRNARERANVLANGGLPPGYKRDPERKGHLLMDDSAQMVRAIFRGYVRLGSAGKTLEEIRRKFRDHPDLGVSVAPLLLHFAQSQLSGVA
ncbi:MAG: recombinase family protein [Spirochaetales bacterium]|nr:recombinase family protein [Spirochaetales bacterium]